DFGKFGFESLVGNLGRSELFGGRGYIRPLRILNKPIPVLQNFAMGFTYITDQDPVVDELLGKPLSIMGIDLEQPLIHNDMLDLYLYFDWSSIADGDDPSYEFGSGTAYGVATDIRGIAGLFALGAKFEMRILNEGFTSGLIGPLYDVNKVSILDKLSLQPATKGWYGEVAGSVLGKISLRGSYFETGEDSNLGDRFVLHADATNVVPVFSAQAYFVKEGLTEDGKIFDFDENTFTIAEVGYKMNRFTTIVMRYEWSYVPDPNNPGKYTTQQRVEPRVMFSFGW
ncbi:MAG: hypothetical protein KAX13_00745, partial [Candidatus Krumholzibacteria bacterium]|nr:hypothetical protein [Candidatus Krumholzibacteria bacterium]